jgi:hypothetical protein
VFRVLCLGFKQTSSSGRSSPLVWCLEFSVLCLGFKQTSSSGRSSLPLPSPHSTCSDMNEIESIKRKSQPRCEGIEKPFTILGTLARNQGIDKQGASLFQREKNSTLVRLRTCRSKCCGPQSDVRLARARQTGNRRPINRPCHPCVPRRRTRHRGGQQGTSPRPW